MNFQLHNFQNKKLLAIFAHPDDESFGPGGTLALYAKRGVEIQILCATRGEAGRGTSEERTKELLAAAKVLGVKKVEFLDFEDGEISNNQYHDLAGKILEKIEAFKPQVLLTFDLTGGSGHLDHIAIALTTTYAFLRQTLAKKLYYFARPNFKKQEEYFIYIPPAKLDTEISTQIDVSDVWDKKIGAMKKYKTQQKDYERLLRMYKNVPKVDRLILYGQHKKETDLFENID